MNILNHGFHQRLKSRLWNSTITLNMNSKLMYHLWFPRLVVCGATSLTDIIGNLLGLDLRELQDCACLSMLESATVITKYWHCFILSQRFQTERLIPVVFLSGWTPVLWLTYDDICVVCVIWRNITWRHIIRNNSLPVQWCQQLFRSYPGKIPEVDQRWISTNDDSEA